MYLIKTNKHLPGRSRHPASRDTSTSRYVGLLLFILSLFGVSHSALAAGTVAGTSVSNSATINYQVGAISQPAITSNAVAFVVDKKVNMTVVTTDAAAVSVTPGSSNNIVTFTVTNTSNDTMDFSLTSQALVGGTAKFTGTDNINASAVSVFVESGATPGYQSAQDTATFIDELAADSSKTVYIVGTFPTGLSNGDIATYGMIAEARAAGGASSLGAALTQDTGADNPSTVQIVFGDGTGTDDASRDAKHSDRSDFKVVTATLAVTKSSSVISDPFNNTTNPKAIPGAVIEYTITITNAASAATASSISVADSLNSEITGGRLAFNTTTYGATQGIQVTAPNINAGVATALTNGSDADQGDFNVTAGNTVTVTGISLTGGQSATVKFRVTVQ
ncbi:MAG: hypothetical protein M3A44_05530 [Gammaproteobacteria bacterium]